MTQAVATLSATPSVVDKVRSNCENSAMLRVSGASFSSCYFAPALGLVLTHRLEGFAQKEATVATRTEPAQLPSPEKLEAATNEIARAIDALDAIRTGVAPPEGEIPSNAGPAAVRLLAARPEVALSVDDVGRLFLFASDAVDAAETLRLDAEAILAELPGLWHDRENANGEWS